MNKIKTLTIILFSIFSICSSVKAQILSEKEKLPLKIEPSQNIVSDEINQDKSCPSKKFFDNVNGIIRVDERTLLLKTKDQFKSRVKIEVDKGYITIGRYKQIYQGNKDKYERETCVEGKLPETVDIKYWEVNKLTVNDKDITVTIYDINRGEILEQKTYKLYPDSVIIYEPRLEYTSIWTGKIEYFMGTKFTDYIDYRMPVTLRVFDNWGNTYKVISHRVTNYGVMYNSVPSIIHSDTLDRSEKSEFKTLRKNRPGLCIDCIKYIINGKKKGVCPMLIER